MTSAQLRYIVIEGPIGVGKTSLARRLAVALNAELILEDPDDNPFLADFYSNPRQAALPAQLFFLMQRAQQLQALRQGDIFNPVKVADFMLEKDQLFARLTLDSAEFELYQQIYSHVAIDVRAPDLVVYLQATVDILLERIQKRGRSYERHIEATYLERINESYARFFLHYSKAPVLVVNAAEIDFMGNDQDLPALLKRMYEPFTGRRFLNRLPFAVDA